MPEQPNHKFPSLFLVFLEKEIEINLQTVLFARTTFAEDFPYPIPAALKPAAPMLFSFRHGFSKRPRAFLRRVSYHSKADDPMPPHSLGPIQTGHHQHMPQFGTDRE